MALGQGINLFDTAAGYGFGKSEEVLGSAIRSYPGAQNITPLICTKFALAPGNTDHSQVDFSGENMVKNVEDSLKRLQAECLGAILLHNPPDDFAFGTYDTTPYEQLIKEGKILAYGVSCRSMKGVANVLGSSFGSVIEAVYNPLDRRYAGFFSNPLYSNKYLFICRVPLASGFISPKTLTDGLAFQENDIRKNFNPEQVEWVTGAVRKLSFLNDLEGGIVVSALRFQLSNTYNTVTIPGMRNEKQVRDAALAMQLGPLPADILDKIADAVPDIFYKWKG